MRQVGAPMDLAASTKVCSRSDSTLARTVLEILGVSTTVRAMITFVMLASSIAIKAMAKRILGMAISPSTKRCNTMSARRK